MSSSIQARFFFLPQISPHGRPRCGSGQPGAAAEKVPAAGSSASAQGLSCTWAQSDTPPLRATGLGTEAVEGPRDHLGPSLGSDDWRHVFEKGDGGGQEGMDRDKRQERGAEDKRVTSV